MVQPPLGLSGISGARIEPGGEIAYPMDYVLWEEGLGQHPQIEPSERCVLEGSVVEIEAVDVEVGDQSLPQIKTETATRTVSTLPPKRQGWYENSTTSGRTGQRAEVLANRPPQVTKNPADPQRVAVSLWGTVDWAEHGNSASLRKSRMWVGY